MHLSMDPDYFEGAVVEGAARGLLRQAPKKAEARAGI
jgi:hypothetical protein